MSPRVEPQNSSRVPFWVPRNKLDQNTGLQSRNWSPFFETTEKVSRSWDSKIKMAAIRLIQNNRRRHRRQNNNNFIHRNIKDRSNPLEDYEDHEIYDRYRLKTAEDIFTLSLGVVDRVSETQLQMGENSN